MLLLFRHLQTVMLNKTVTLNYYFSAFGNNIYNTTVGQDCQVQNDVSNVQYSLVISSSLENVTDNKMSQIYCFLLGPARYKLRLRTIDRRMADAN